MEIYRVFTERGEREINSIWGWDGDLHEILVGALISSERYLVPPDPNPFTVYTCPHCGRLIAVEVYCNFHHGELKILHMGFEKDGSISIVVEECPECKEIDNGGNVHV